MKDFFISYTQSDLDRARWISNRLEAAGYTTIAQFKDMPPGSNFVIESERGGERGGGEGQTQAALFRHGRCAPVAAANGGTDSRFKPRDGYYNEPQ